MKSARSIFRKIENNNVRVSRLNVDMAIVNNRIVSAFFDSNDGVPPALAHVKITAIIQLMLVNLQALV